MVGSGGQGNFLWLLHMWRVINYKAWLHFLRKIKTSMQSTKFRHQQNNLLMNQLDYFGFLQSGPIFFTRRRALGVFTRGMNSKLRIRNFSPEQYQSKSVVLSFRSLNYSIFTNSLIVKIILIRSKKAIQLLTDPLPVRTPILSCRGAAVGFNVITKPP